MSNTNSRKRPTRNEQREAARAKARELREQNAKKARSRKWIVQGLIAVAVIAVIAIVVIPISQSVNNNKAFVRPANMASDGIVLTGPNMAAVTSPAGDDGTPGVTSTAAPVAGVTNIVLYEDYLCPACKAFDDANGATLEKLVNTGAATLEVHPIGMLWQKSAGTEYSRRSAAAAACVANFSPNSFWAVNQALYANQPQEGTPGLTDAQLQQLAASVNPSNQADIDSCIKNKTFVPWVKGITDTALNGPMTAAAKAAGETSVGTPTVIVNGQKYTGSINDKAAFLAFVTKASAAK